MQAVRIKNIYKEFNIPSENRSSLKEFIVSFGKKREARRQQVLEGISFDINKGDFFGIVGRNGSGKSTLLKIIAGVYRPNEGEIIMNGSLTPFIELGVGFNPELSAEDNVYLNGALLGFSRKEIRQMYADIVSFAELDGYMSKKLKNFSSGMQVRLAFSIAIKAKKEILMFDEVLAVGDEAFQQKCLNVFEQYKKEKQTVILVTHEMETVRRFCNKAVLIEGGKLVAIGSPRDITKEYSLLNLSEEERNRQPVHNITAKIKYKEVSENELNEINFSPLHLREKSTIFISFYSLEGTLLGKIKKTDNFRKHCKIIFTNPFLAGKYRILIEQFIQKDLISFNDQLLYEVISSDDSLRGAFKINSEWK